jgi:hypothetical protein
MALISLKLARWLQDCNFETSDCPHWMVDEEEEDEGGNSPLPPQSFRFQHGLIPTGFSLPFWIEPRFLGEILAILFFNVKYIRIRIKTIIIPRVFPVLRVLLFLFSQELLQCQFSTRTPLNSNSPFSLRKWFLALTIRSSPSCTSSGDPRPCPFVPTTVVFRLGAISEKCNLFCNKLFIRYLFRSNDFVFSRSVSLTSAQPFRIRILAERNTSVAYRTPFFRTPKNERIEQPFVIIKQIKAKTPFCKLETPTEQACNALTCNFKGYIE